jgi:hypothetical protein
MRYSRPISTVLALLRFDKPEVQLTETLTDTAWGRVLAFSDRNHVTLLLQDRSSDVVPEWVSERLRRNFVENCARFQRIKDAYREIAELLSRSETPYVVLKGFAPFAGYPRDPRRRMQSDIDILCPPQSAQRVSETLASIGYKAAFWARHVSSPLHLPAMVRETEYEWKGNFFDPDMPLSIDVHTRMWNAEVYGFGPRVTDEFWNRRIDVSFEELKVPTLHPVDAIGFASLHALRHAILGSLQLGHIHEIAWLLHSTREDKGIWTAWKEWHESSLRRLEVVVFYIASCWFKCVLPAEVTQEVERLPPSIRWWLETFVDENGGDWSVKDALWLRMGLADASKRLSILSAGLMGGRSRTVASFSHEIDESKTRRSALQRIRTRAEYATYFSRRFFHHAYMLPRTLWNGLKWWQATGKNEVA